MTPGNEFVPTTGVRFRPMRPGEEKRVSEVALRSFDEFVAPGYDQEGIRECHGIFGREAIEKRQGRGHFILVAEAGNEIVGMIEIRDNRHISMLFVGKDHMHSGIGGELVRRGIEKARAEGEEAGEITVNSSPFAVPVYGRMGFAITGEEQTVNGIRCVPMHIVLQKEP